MLILQQSATAGTLESSDALVTVEPHTEGVEVHVESVVLMQYGESIKATAYEVLSHFGVQQAQVRIVDKGAIDAVLRARLRTAICRAAQISYDWSQEGVDHAD